MVNSEYNIIRNIDYVYYVQYCILGVTLTLASLFECRQFNQGGHKFGIGLELAL